MQKLPKGIINTNYAQFGYVYLWNRPKSTTSRKERIKTKLSPKTPSSPLNDDLIAFTQDASLAGEASLSAVDKAVLEAEAASRSSIDTKNFTAIGLVNFHLALPEPIKVKPDQ